MLCASHEHHSLIIIIIMIATVSASLCDFMAESAEEDRTGPGLK